MDIIIRASVLYIFLLLIMRLSGKRNMAEVSPFSFILLLVVAEATQQALLGNDFSITTAVLVIVTLITIEFVLAVLKQKSTHFETWAEGSPLVLVENGTLLRDRMQQVKIDESDIMSAARKTQGIATLAQIQYVVLEKNGGLSVVPRQGK